MAYSLQEPEKKIELATKMLDSFGFKANDTQLEDYITIAQAHSLEDVATCTAAFRRGDVKEHDKKQFPPSPALFGETITRFKIERLKATRPKPPKQIAYKQSDRANPERVKELTERFHQCVAAEREELPPATKRPDGTLTSDFEDQDWFSRTPVARPSIPLPDDYAQKLDDSEGVRDEKTP